MPPPVNSRGLYPAEEKFLTRLQQGRPCRAGEDSSRIPPRPEEGNADNILRGAVIRQFLVGDNAVLSPAMPIIELVGYWVEGELNLYFASIPAGMVFCNCHFDSPINLAFAECRSVSFDGSRLRGGIVLHGATIRGNLNMNNFHGQFQFRSDADVRLIGAHIHGDLSCSGGIYCASEEAALVADRARIDGDVMANAGFTANGDVRFLDARIGGNLNCLGGTIKASKEAALILNGARIDRNVSLEGTRLENSLSGGSECGVAGDSMHVGGNLFFRQCHTIGEAKFSLAKIGGDMDCSGSVFRSAGGVALSARGAAVGGNFFISDGMFVNGGVDICGARINLGLSCVGATLMAPEENAPAMMAENIRVGAMLWRDMKGRGVVNLASSSVSTLSDNIDAWDDFNVALDGFSYDRLVDADTTANFRKRWLAKRPPKMGFSPQPYEQVAKALRAMGKHLDAWDIEREKRNQEWEEMDAKNAQQKARWPRLKGWMKNTLRKLWGKGVVMLTNSVYRPWKPLLLSAAIVLAGGVLFDYADDHGRMVPHQPAALVNPKYQYGRIPAETPPETMARNLPGYPEFNPFWFSLDVFVPLFDLHQESFWYPAPDGGRPDWWYVYDKERLSRWDWLEWWYWFQISAGWVLTSLLLLAAASVLRPNLSSSGKD